MEYDDVRLDHAMEGRHNLLRALVVVVRLAQGETMCYLRPYREELILPISDLHSDHLLPSARLWYSIDKKKKNLVN